MQERKLHSRKLWITVGGSLLISALTVVLCFMGVNEIIITTVIGWLGKAILGGVGFQGAVDVTKAIRTGKEIARTLKDETDERVERPESL